MKEQKVWEQMVTPDRSLYRHSFQINTLNLISQQICSAHTKQQELHSSTEHPCDRDREQEGMKRTERIGIATL